MTRLVASILLLACATASAEPDPPSCATHAPDILCTFHVDLEGLGNRTDASGGDLGGLAVHLALGKMYGVGNVKRELSVGGLFEGSVGESTQLARSTMPPAAEPSWFNAGPEVQAGLAFFKGGERLPNRLYASASPMYSRIADDRGIGGRVAVGGNWMGSQMRFMHRHDAEKHSATVLMLFVPQNFEVVAEHEHGSTFTGGALGWGI